MFGQCFDGGIVNVPMCSEDSKFVFQTLSIKTPCSSANLRSYRKMDM